MAIEALKTPDKSTTLEDLALFIWANEIVWGQATQIGNNGEVTVVVFDDTKHIPEVVNNDVRVAVLDGSEDAPTGAHAFLCQGTAFVSNVKAHVKVYRV